MARPSSGPQALPDDNPADYEDNYPEDLIVRIRAKAKELYLARGRQHGRDWEDWFEAERIVQQDMERLKKRRE